MMAGCWNKLRIKTIQSKLFYLTQSEEETYQDHSILAGLFLYNLKVYVGSFYYKHVRL